MMMINTFWFQYEVMNHGGGGLSRVRSGGGVKGERKTEATARARNIHDRWARDFP